jgi:hypothetical protein
MIPLEERTVRLQETEIRPLGSFETHLYTVYLSPGTRMVAMGG